MCLKLLRQVFGITAAQRSDSSEEPETFVDVVLRVHSLRCADPQRGEAVLTGDLQHVIQLLFMESPE